MPDHDTDGNEPTPAGADQPTRIIFVRNHFEAATAEQAIAYPWMRQTVGEIGANRIQPSRATGIDPRRWFDALADLGYLRKAIIDRDRAAADYVALAEPVTVEPTLPAEPTTAESCAMDIVRTIRRFHQAGMMTRDEAVAAIRKVMNVTDVGAADLLDGEPDVIWAWPEPGGPHRYRGLPPSRTDKLVQALGLPAGTPISRPSVQLSEAVCERMNAAIARWISELPRTGHDA